MLWEKGREGNARSVQELGLSAAMPKFVPLSGDSVGTCHPLAEDPMAGQRQPGQGADISLLRMLSRSRGVPAPLIRKAGEYAAIALTASVHSNNVVVHDRSQTILEEKVCRHNELHYLRSPKWDKLGSG